MSIWPILQNALLEGMVYGILPVGLISAITMAVAYTFIRNWFGSLTISSFAAVGCFLGIFVGGSREPVVGAVLPGIVTFIGALVAFYFSREKEVFDRKLVPPTLLGLVLSAAFGASFASELRATNAQFEYMRDIEKSRRDSTLKREERFEESVVNVLNRYALCIKQFEKETCEKVALAKTP